MNGVSTYPFEAFGGSWAKASMDCINKGDTVIGNDVWIGNSARIMTGIKIGALSLEQIVLL
jgi:virginiamycin A acetyltransferase